jgi:hypothetical protein
MTSLKNKRPGEAKRPRFSSKSSRATRSSPLSSFDGRGVIPAEYKAKLRYAFIGTAAASTSYTEVVFSGSSAADPGLGSDTKQPVGFAQLAAWYNSYRVIAAHAELVCTMASSSATPTATAIGGDIVLYPNASASAPALLATAISQPRAQWSRLALGSVCKLNSRGGHKLTNGMSGFGYDGTSASTGSSPSNAWCFHIGFAADAAYTGISTEYTMKITYDVVFFSRKLVEVAMYEKASHKFYTENASSWLAAESSLKPVERFSEEAKKMILETERTDAKESKEVGPPNAIPTPARLEANPRQQSLSQSLVIPDSVRDYAWVKLQTPLLKSKV